MRSRNRSFDFMFNGFWIIFLIAFLIMFPLALYNLYSYFHDCNYNWFFAEQAMEYHFWTGKCL